ncbi:unnamed protein product [Ostreobium quekettii]|uniref:HIT domain-containing protein n=1 Tax=Ostreobium quekettii TaxID=121088 RepID=A0A8S1IM98_9CHLO|nr:unnamed protein product [Ostreobium quekettii]|eukprot:evm.model.scf_387.7 EVM.evm.TU.scf_387.7   scf_387:87646-92758(-)
MLCTRPVTRALARGQRGAECYGRGLLLPAGLRRSTGMSDDSQQFKFGQWPIDRSQVFLTTDLSYAFVNLKPVVPGHVLISPKRVAKRFGDLTQDEVSDLWQLAQKVGRGIESHHQASSLTFAIQDGPVAGQTVEHVHIHCMPRKEGDFEKNDKIYDEIEKQSEEYKKAAESNFDLDKERKDRTDEEMAAEAAEYRQLFQC